jgi:hypothetical protein
MEFTEKEYELILCHLKMATVNYSTPMIKLDEVDKLIEKIEKRYDNCWILNVNEDIDVEGSYDIECGNAVDGYGIIAHLKKGVDYPLQSEINLDYDEGHCAIINHHPHGIKWYSVFLPPDSYTVKNGICEDVDIETDNLPDDE